MKIIQGDFEKQEGIYYEYDPHSKSIGEGGMGVVYKGFRVNASTGVRQVVAIKAMKDGLPTEVYLRAQREADIRLKNDNLVEMMGFIVTTEQEFGGRSIRRYYVVSEFLNGVVLTDLLKGNFKNCEGIEVPYAKQLYTSYISNKEITSVQIIKRVLAGIMALHDKGYIHRDIDPSNIMVTKEGNLKMIDFGIAKYVGQLGTQDSSRTATGKFIGKAEYASPELVLGAVNDQNYSTDIYAIGILFYQLLVGSLPFDGPQYDILQAQLKKKIPLYKVPYREYRSIIRKATSKRQASRYQTCVEMRLAVDNPPSVIDWKTIMKVAAAVLLVCVMGYEGYDFISRYYSQPSGGNSEQTISKAKDVNPPLAPTSDEKYNHAYSLVNSEVKDSAVKGWLEIKKLADAGYGKAKNDVGITLCPWDEAVTSSIKKRRRLLNLSGQNKDKSLKLSLEYLSSIKDTKDITGEGLAALGLNLFRDEKYPECHAVMARAKDSLPYNHPLYKTVEKYYIDSK